MRFLRNFAASLSALIVFSVVGFFIFIGIINLMNDDTVEIEENSVLHLKLDKPIEELEYDDPLSNLAGFGHQGNTIGLVQLIDAINHAAEDESIQGILLECREISGGYSTAEDIRQALLKFKESGKFVVSYSDYYMEKGYYLASVADDIYMNPIGDVEFNGISASVMFLKGLFEKLEIEPEIFRVGEFKSAVEPFMRTSMSEENRLQLTELLNSINSNTLQSVAEERGLSIEKTSEISRQMLIRSAEDAYTMGFLDSLLYYDQVLENIKQRIDKFNLVSYAKYKKSYVPFVEKSEGSIAVIVGEGDIVMGGDDRGLINGTKYAELIRKARENDKVKAIVLRINSPGGQMIASDLIWREVILASEEKPVIASMGDVAASGGYYMAMATDKIVAQKNTITGSIGIFGMLFNMQGFLNNKLGVNVEEVNTGEFSSIFTFSRPLTDIEKEIIQRGTEKGYQTFIENVAEGRGMDIEEVKKVASGRVWSGEQALEMGLVDELGSLSDAIKIAAEMAGIEKYRLNYYPKRKTLLENLMSPDHEVAIQKIQQDLGLPGNTLQKVKSLVSNQGIQARMLFDIELK